MLTALFGWLGNRGRQAASPATEEPAFSIDAALKMRLPHYHPDVPLLVACSQKAGCTSVLKWFLFQAGLLEEAARFTTAGVGLDIHAYEDSVFKAGPEYKTSVAGALQAGLPMVNFVRCPYQRAFSSYLQIHSRFYINQERKGIDSPGIRLRRAVRISPLLPCSWPKSMASRRRIPASLGRGTTCPRARCQSMWACSCWSAVFPSTPHPCFHSRM